MKNTGYSVDFKKEIINITANFRERASIVNSKEYKELIQLRKDYSDFTFKYAPKVKATKETYKGLTIEFIEQYVKNHDNCNTLTVELDKAKVLYKELNNGRPASYPQLKQWFINKFPELTGEEIRMEIAAEAAAIDLIDSLEKKVKKANKNKINKKFVKIDTNEGEIFSLTKASGE